jgi:hypothetical protein
MTNRGAPFSLAERHIKWLAAEFQIFSRCHTEPRRRRDLTTCRGVREQSLRRRRRDNDHIM